MFGERLRFDRQHGPHVAAQTACLVKMLELVVLFSTPWSVAIHDGWVSAIIHEAALGAQPVRIERLRVVYFGVVGDGLEIRGHASSSTPTASKLGVTDVTRV
jgi:hypothetical protein